MVFSLKVTGAGHPTPVFLAERLLEASWIEIGKGLFSTLLEAAG